MCLHYRGHPSPKPKATRSTMHCSHACRCHGSKFDVTNGAVVNGPAQDPVETYETREVDGTLKIEA